MTIDATTPDPAFVSGESAPDLERFRPGLLVILRQVLDDRSRAEDLCNDTICVALERLAKRPLDDIDRLDAYLAQTARNLAIAERRKNGRRRTVTNEDSLIELHASSEPSADDLVQARQRSSAIREVLKELKPRRDRELLVRYYLHDHDKSAICRDLGISDAHFNRVIFRARERFRTLLGRRYRAEDLLCFTLVESRCGAVV